MLRPTVVEALAGAKIIMRFHKFAYVCLAATLGGCVVPQDLGDTATGSSSGGGSAEGGSEGGEGSTGGPTSDSMSGPSSMSGVSLTGSTGFASMTEGTTEPATDTEGESSSTGNTEACDATDSPLSWTGTGFDLLTAVSANSRFTGVGRCTGTADGDNTMVLSCTMDGRRDGVDFEDEAVAFSITLEGATPNSETWGTVTLEDFGARLVVESGFETGGERWFVADAQYAPDDGVMPGVILTDGFRVAPPDDAFNQWYEGSWFDGPGFSITDASCGFIQAACGDEVRALEAGWVKRTANVGHSGEYFEFSSPFEETWFGVWPGALWEVPKPMCLDYPVSVTQFVAIARTP